jgi:hypothetical protein
MYEIPLLLHLHAYTQKKKREEILEAKLTKISEVRIPEKRQIH